MKPAPLCDVPSVEKLLQALAGGSGLPRPLVTDVVRREVAAIRERLRAGAAAETVAQVQARLGDELARLERSRLQPLINGTGVVIHTNLGRAPLSGAAAERVRAVAAGYCNLEFDLDSGERGRRGSLVERALAVLVEAESATVVNNCAAALVLVLRHFTQGGRKEVVISRGELIEIGGGFRVPEIMETSGARLREIGSTNKTSLADYEAAVGPETAIILKVHRSNFYMEGFTESPGLADLVALARRHGVPVIEDLGSGAMVGTESLNALDHEPTAAESIRAGVDLVCVSGDKLLGGPQAGIIAGKGIWVSQLKEDPFFRVLRCDKLMLAALQETVLAYLHGVGEGIRHGDRPRSVEPTASPTTHPAIDVPTLCDAAIPVVRMLAADLPALRSRAEAIAASAGRGVTVGQGTSRCGGGTMPKSALPSVTLDLHPANGSIVALARRLRLGTPPVVGYIAGDVVKVDLRTVFPGQDESLVAAIRHSLGNPPG